MTAKSSELAWGLAFLGELLSVDLHHNFKKNSGSSPTLAKGEGIFAIPLPYTRKRPNCQEIFYRSSCPGLFFLVGVGRPLVRLHPPKKRRMVSAFWQKSAKDSLCIKAKESPHQPPRFPQTPFASLVRSAPILPPPTLALVATSRSSLRVLLRKVPPLALRGQVG